MLISRDSVFCLFAFMAIAKAIPVANDNATENVMIIKNESQEYKQIDSNATIDLRQSPIDDYLITIGAIARPIVESISPIANAVGPILSSTISEVVTTVMNFVNNQTSNGTVNITISTSSSTTTTRPVVVKLINSEAEQDKTRPNESEQINEKIAGTLEEFMQRKLVKANQNEDESSESDPQTERDARKIKRPIKKAHQFKPKTIEN